MRDFSIEDELKRKLIKLKKKDKARYNIIVNKMDEILNCMDVNHYKNLKQPLQKYKRVHLKGAFVLTFKYIESDDKISFYKFGHHDEIYE